MILRVRITCLAVLLLALPAGSAFGQSLADLARKEKERREQIDASGVGVKVHKGSGLALAEVEVSSAPNASVTNTAAAATPTARIPAPDFSLPDRIGRKFSLSSFRGNPVLIDFWASWCGPCRKSMPGIERLYREYRPRGLQVVGINIEGRTDAALNYLARGQYTFPVLFDSGNWESPVAQSYGVQSIPRTFLLDGDGNIVFAGHPAALPESLLESLLR